MVVAWRTLLPAKLENRHSLTENCVAEVEKIVIGSPGELRKVQLNITTLLMAPPSTYIPPNPTSVKLIIDTPGELETKYTIRMFMMCVVKIYFQNSSNNNNDNKMTYF